MKKLIFTLTFVGAGDRTRSGTELSLRGILSPLRLPISPRRRQCEV